MTYSVVLHQKEKKGENQYFGIAVATKHFAVGCLVPHIKQNIGAIATQANTNPHLAIDGLEKLSVLKEKDNFSTSPNKTNFVESALSYALGNDPFPYLRQVHGVDWNGNAWAWSGKNIKPVSLHTFGPHYSIAGNYLASKDIVLEMESTLLNLLDKDISFEEKLLLTLEAGEKAGGDYRGRQSAALVTQAKQPFPYCNLRVDNHPEPLIELRKLWEEFNKSYYQDFIKEIPSQ